MSATGSPGAPTGRFQASGSGAAGLKKKTHLSAQHLIGPVHAHVLFGAAGCSGAVLA